MTSVRVRAAARRDGSWSPLRQPIFRALWLAAIASNIGTWMHDMAASWLMTGLTSSPLTISLVQTATLAPVLLFAPIAGVVTDVVDRRRLVLAAQWWMLCASVALATVALAGTMTPVPLLALTFLLNVGTAFGTPAWFAVIPEMVLPRRSRDAITLNSVAFNSARAAGPALGGLLIAHWGASAAFLLNALSFLAVIAVLRRWHGGSARAAAPEHLARALREEVSAATHPTRLRELLVRAAGFGAGGAALWGLLPTIARARLHLDAVHYGLTFAMVGIGVFGGTGFMGRVQRRYAFHSVAGSGAVVFGVAMLGVAVARGLTLLLVALLVAGAGWIAVNSAFINAIQQWAHAGFRGRAMAIYLAAILGATAIGSAAWGALATTLGVRIALGAAAGVVCLVGVLTMLLSDARETPVVPVAHAVHTVPA